MERVSNKALLEMKDVEQNIHDMMLLGMKPKPKFKRLHPRFMYWFNRVLLLIWWSCVVLLIANCIA